MCLRWAAHTLPLMHERRPSGAPARRNLWVVLALLDLLGILVVLGGLIIYSFRRERHTVAAQPVLAEKTAATLSLEERLREAEAEAAEAKERLAAAERQIKDASTLQIPASIVAQVDELEARMAAHAAERERSDSEMQRLSAELEARMAELVTKDSELAQARE